MLRTPITYQLFATGVQLCTSDLFHLQMRGKISEEKNITHIIQQCLIYLVEDLQCLSNSLSFSLCLTLSPSVCVSSCVWVAGDLQWWTGMNWGGLNRQSDVGRDWWRGVVLGSLTAESLAQTQTMTQSTTTK